MSRLGNSQLLQPVPPAPRTLGVVHLSDIYKILMIRREPERFDPSRPMDLKRVELGLLFESMLERALAEKFATVRPGEIVSPEGIYMSPDGVNPALGCGEEYKATYMSCREGISEVRIVDGQPTDWPLDKFYCWFVQMMGYAKWLDTLAFMLRVLFVRGDYKYLTTIEPGTRFKRTFPNEPLFKSYRIEFTQAEVDANWTMLLDLAREEGLI